MGVKLWLACSRWFVLAKLNEGLLRGLGTGEGCLTSDRVKLRIEKLESQYCCSLTKAKKREADCSQLLDESKCV